MKSFFILLFVTFFSIQIASQNKLPEAVKVDEYEARTSQPRALVESTLRFIQTIANLPNSTRGTIIVYSAVRPACEFFHDLTFDSKDEATIKRLLRQNPAERRRIAIITGQFRLETHVEFWQVPEGTKQPQLEVWSVDPGCCCPEMSLRGPSSIQVGEKLAKFSVKLSPVSFYKGATFHWEASAGQIVSKQGRQEIILDASKVNSANIVVRVVLNGNPSCNCPNSLEKIISVSK